MSTFASDLSKINVVDAYNRLPEDDSISSDLNQNTFKYKIIFHNNIWDVYSIYDDKKKVNSIIDITNGYIKIHEDINSATLLSVDQEFAIFTSKSNNIYCALNIMARQVLEDTRTFKFYKINNNTIQDITLELENELSSKIDFSIFFKTKSDYKKYVIDNPEISPFTLYFKIPQKGTIVEITVEKDNVLDQIQLYKNQDPEKVKFLKKYLKSLSDKIIKFNWNTANEKFDLLK